MQTKVDAPAQQSQQLRNAPKQTELAPNESQQLFEDSRPVVSQMKAMQAVMANSPQQQAMQTMSAKNGGRSSSRSC